MATHRSMHSFDPAKVAHYETENWIAYYRRQWLRLMRVSVAMVGESFGLPLQRALVGAYLVARAEMAAAPVDNDISQAQAYMRRFYRMVKNVHSAAFDVDRAARLEVNWWVVHRRLFGQPAIEPLIEALTDLYAEAYQVAPERVRDAAYHRGQAMVYSDRWVTEGRVEGSPLLRQVEAELMTSYRSLKAAVTTGED